MSEYIKKEAIIAKARKLQFERILTENEVEAVMLVLASIHKMDVIVDYINNPTTEVLTMAGINLTVHLEYEEVVERLKADGWVIPVRCKYCTHRDPEDHKCDCGENERQGCPFPVDDDYYCPYGERRDDGADNE